MNCTCGREVVAGSVLVKRVTLGALGCTFYTAEPGLVDALTEQIAQTGVVLEEDFCCLGCVRDAVAPHPQGHRMPGVGLWLTSPAGLVLVHESVLSAMGLS